MNGAKASLPSVVAGSQVAWGAEMVKGVNLDSNRIAYTRVHPQNGLSLDDLQMVAAKGSEKGHIRAKLDDDGGTVLYGHRVDAKGFHWRHSDRQDAGTLVVAQTIRDYAAGKPKEIQDLATKLLGNFMDGDKVAKRMTNADVLDMHGKLTSLERKFAGVNEFADKLGRDPGVPLVNGERPIDVAQEFKMNLQVLNFVIDDVGVGGPNCDLEAVIKSGTSPELLAGIAMNLVEKAILNNLALSEQDKSLLLKVLDPGGNNTEHYKKVINDFLATPRSNWTFSEAELNEVQNEIDNAKNKKDENSLIFRVAMMERNNKSWDMEQDNISAMLDLLKNRFFEPHTYAQEVAEQKNSAGTFGKPDSKIYLCDANAHERLGLEGMSPADHLEVIEINVPNQDRPNIVFWLDAKPFQKLDMLKKAFAEHLSHPSEKVGNQPQERGGDDEPVLPPTNGQRLAEGLKSLLTQVGYDVPKPNEVK